MYSNTGSLGKGSPLKKSTEGKSLPRRMSHPGPWSKGNEAEAKTRLLHCRDPFPSGGLTASGVAAAWVEPDAFPGKEGGEKCDLPVG